jgi:hypothetical protein
VFTDCDLIVPFDIFFFVSVALSSSAYEGLCVFCLRPPSKTHPSTLVLSTLFSYIRLMFSAGELNNGRSDGQWEVLPADWLKTVFHSASWSYPPLQGNPARRFSKRTALLRISKANRALNPRITKYLNLDDTSATASGELSSDLAGVKVVEEVLEPYERDAGFSMLDNIFEAMRLGWTLSETSLFNLETSSNEFRPRWDRDVQKFMGDIREPIPYDKSVPVKLTPEEGEERLKFLSPLWDLILADTSIFDLVRSGDIIDLTDSELSADSDPPPMTPKAGKDSPSTLSHPSIKPLNATASSFVPSPARFTSLGSSSSSSASPSPSPPVLDIINFPTLKQTILSPSRTDDHDGKTKWSSKRASSLMPSFLAEKAESGLRKSKTRQMVDEMRSGSDAHKPDSDFILVKDDRSNTDPACNVHADVSQGTWKASRRRARRGRDSISTVSTDNASIRSSSIERPRNNSQSLGSFPSSRSQGTRQPSKQSKRISSGTLKSPPAAPLPPTPVFSSPAGSVSSFGGPVTPGPFTMQFPPPPPPPTHPAFMHMNGRVPPYPPPFPYSYYSGLPGSGMIPSPAAFASSYQIPYAPYNAYGKGIITGSSGIRHAPW